MHLYNKPANTICVMQMHTHRIQEKVRACNVLAASHCHLSFWFFFLTLFSLEQTDPTFRIKQIKECSVKVRRALVSLDSPLKWFSVLDDIWLFLWVNICRSQIGLKKYFLFGFCNQPHYSVESCRYLILVLLSMCGFTTHILPCLKSHIPIILILVLKSLIQN